MHQARHVAGLIVSVPTVATTKRRFHSRTSTKRPAIAAAAIPATPDGCGLVALPAFGNRTRLRALGSRERPCRRLVMYRSLTGIAGIAAVAILAVAAVPSAPVNAAPIRHASGLAEQQSMVETVQYRRGHRRHWHRHAWRPYHRRHGWRAHHRRWAWRPYYRPYYRRYAWRPYYRRYAWGPYYPGAYAYAGYPYRYPYYRRHYYYGGPGAFIRIGPIGFGFW